MGKGGMEGEYILGRQGKKKEGKVKWGKNTNRSGIKKR